jgi:uncharacterized membrane protein
LCCGLVGLFGAAANTLLYGKSFFYGPAFGAVLSFLVFFVVAMPLNMGILPLAWASFYKSPRRGLALAGFGLLGGTLTGLFLAARWEDAPSPAGLTIILIATAAGLVCGRVFPFILARL